jgi:microsomal dipeptidase-like Zn-dependent dipeptidase
MSFFGFGNLLPGYGSLIGGALSAFGEYKANQDTKAYGTKMSGTAHQRQMADLKKAGINPILAGRLGGASTPSYRAGNIGSAAVQGYGQVSSARQAQAQTKQLEAQTGLTKAQTEKVRTEVLKEIPAKVRKLNAEGLLAQAKTTVAEAEAVFKDLTNRLLKGDLKALKKLGLSAMQLKHAPGNQIGSIIIDKLMQYADKILGAE